MVKKKCSDPDLSDRETLLVKNSIDFENEISELILNTRYSPLLEMLEKVKKKRSS